MFVTEARHYIAERLLTPRIGLLGLFLLACVLPVADTGWIVLIPTACLFILTFRLWDDLADLDYDRAFHSDRTLVLSSDLRLFHAVHWSLLVLFVLTLVELESGSVTGFLILVAALWANYRLTAARSALRPWRAALVLAKYPAFVFLAAGQPGETPVLSAAAVAYLVPLIDEMRSSGVAILMPAAILSVLALLARWLLLM